MTNEIQLLREARPRVSGPSSALHDKQRKLLLEVISPARGERRFGPRPVGVLLVAAAAIAAVAFVVAGTGSRASEAWAASVVKVAQTAPRLLLDAEGWTLTRADQFGGDAGEVTFANGNREVELRWQPTQDYARSLADLTTSANAVATTTALGAPARIFRYDGTDDYTAVWVADSHTLELEGNAADVKAFESILGALQVVDVDSWLSAMPSSVVLPGGQNDVIRSMLSDIPLPQGVDRSQFNSGGAVRDRYQLGAQVVSAVSCGWIGEWLAAKRVGDVAVANEAVNAMEAVGKSSVLAKMDSQGAYPTVVREYAAAMARNTNVVGRYAIGDLTVEESYRSSLGCGR